MKEEKRPEVSLIIPTKNEERTIARIIHQARPFVDELLVIDGHSTDKTREIAREAGARVELDHGKGKGDGIRVGIQKAKGEILVFIDADGSHDPKDIPKLIESIVKGKAEMVIGSRMLGGSDELHGTINNFIRMVGASLIALGINYRWKVSLTDPLNGFRAIKKEVAQSLKLHSKRFEIEHEMVMKALKRGYRVLEIPSHEYIRQGGKSKLFLSEGWRFILRFIKEIW